MGILLFLFFKLNDVYIYTYICPSLKKLYIGTHVYIYINIYLYIIFKKFYFKKKPKK